MVRPDRDTFRVLARHGRAVPLVREVLADLDTPLASFLLHMATSAISVVTEVIKVRLSVSFSDTFISSTSGICLYLRRFSRTRSKTTTVSLSE